MQLKANQQNNLDITLEIGRVPLIPDADTASYTVYDHLGVALVENVNLSMGIADYIANLVIDTSLVQITAPRRFEKRTIIVRFEHAGKPVSVTKVFQVVPELFYSTTPMDVRNFLGLGAKELPDDAIDLLTAYLEVEFDIGETVLTSALVSGSLLEIYSNNMIMLRAALSLIPSLQQRIAQSESDGLLNFDRIRIKDFSSLTQEASTRYTIARQRVTGTIDQTNITYLIVTTDADPITG